MATKQAHKRLTKEYKSMVETPPPYIIAHPSENNILEWHYLITGPPNTPYEGGQYHGTLVFTHEYPFKPPAIRMITPSGRFKPNTRLCLSMSDYHPDLWNPAWSVATILNGLLSFMTGTEATTGSIASSDQSKKAFARSSLEWNAKNNDRFQREFPELVSENLKKIAELRKQEIQAQLKVKESSQDKQSANAVIDPNTLSPEDRIRYLAAQSKKQQANVNVDEGQRSNVIYYVLVVAIALGFFKFIN